MDVNIFSLLLLIQLFHLGYLQITNKLSKDCLFLFCDPKGLASLLYA